MDNFKLIEKNGVHKQRHKTNDLTEWINNFQQYFEMKHIRTDDYRYRFFPLNVLGTCVI